jgi:hypothetical protein
MWVPELSGSLLRFSYQQMHSTPYKNASSGQVVLNSISAKGIGLGSNATLSISVANTLAVVSTIADATDSVVLSDS